MYYLDRLCLHCGELIGDGERVPIPDELTRKVHYLHHPLCSGAVQHLVEQEYRYLLIRLHNRRLR